MRQSLHFGAVPSSRSGPTGCVWCGGFCTLVRYLLYRPGMAGRNWCSAHLTLMRSSPYSGEVLSSLWCGTFFTVPAQQVVFSAVAPLLWRGACSSLARCLLCMSVRRPTRTEGDPPKPASELWFGCFTCLVWCLPTVMHPVVRTFGQALSIHRNHRSMSGSGIFSLVNRNSKPIRKLNRG